MQPYKNLSGNSGVVAYRIHVDAIVIVFRKGDEAYRYSYASAGSAAVERMKKLASSGRGLATYIAQNDPAYE